MTIGFGELIRKFRKDNKLTQEKFGQMINRKQETISNYEKGIHFPIDAEEIKMIAKAMGESVVTVIDAIQYSRTGTIEQNEAVLVELDKTDDLATLQKRFKFVVGGEEVTGEELEKALEFIKFQRFTNRDDSN